MATNAELNTYREIIKNRLDAELLEAGQECFLNIDIYVCGFGQEKAKGDRAALLTPSRDPPGNLEIMLDLINSINEEHGVKVDGGTDRIYITVRVPKEKVEIYRHSLDMAAGALYMHTERIKSAL